MHKDYTPVTKTVLGGLVVSSVAFNFPLQQYRHWFTYQPTSLFEKCNVLGLLRCRSIFIDPKDVICASILLYHFRIFERRYGSRKFASCLIGTCILSSLLEIAVLQICRILDVSVDEMPGGMYGPIFSFFVPYFCEIPRVAVTTVLGIPVTGKSLIYILGLQMASSSFESFLLAACGVVAGLIYKNNLLYIQSLLRVPQVVGQMCDRTIGRLVMTSEPTEPNSPLGATLEIQRQQHIERLEQQMAWAQLGQAQQPQQQRMGFRFFGNGNQGRAAAANHNGPVLPQASEAQIQQLVDMGFSRDRAENALRLTNNDTAMATNILLQEA